MIEVKCIFKPKFFDYIFDHNPLKPNYNIKIVESVNNTEQLLNPYYNNLREIDITEGYLLCYHYIIVSIENCLNKIIRKIYYQMIIKK